MNQQSCLSLLSHSEKQTIELGKTYTQPHLEIENKEKWEIIPLKDNSYQNRMNKTVKIVKLRCFTKEDSQNDNQLTVKTRTGSKYLQEKNKKILQKKQESSLFGKLKKNVLKPVPAKSKLVMQQQTYWNNKANMTYTDIMPNSRKNSSSLCQQKGIQLSDFVSNNEDNKSLESKGKNELTLQQSQKDFQSKLNNSCKQSSNTKSNLQKNTESAFSISYPYNTSIQINLFNPRSINTLQSSKASSKGKSLSRDKSQERRSSNSLHKNVQKDSVSIRNQEKIQNTIQKLKKFQIVNDYANRGELQNMIKGFILSGEQQCKWVLLVIDDIFKKLKSSVCNDKL